MDVNSRLKSTTPQPDVHSPEHAPSWYAATVNDCRSYPTLAGSLQADVCVVGGGFTGVATALELSLLGYSVIVLEQYRLGWGASGRNGGQLIRGIGHGCESLRRYIGQEGIDEITRMGFESVQIVRDRIQTHKIACDLRMGFFEAANTARHMAELEQEHNQLLADGYRETIQIIDKQDVGQFVGTDAYQGGMIDWGSGHLHPLNLCLGEAILAEAQGVRFYENSPVLRIDRKEEPVVYTANGQVRANYVVLAGNAYISALEPRISGKILPAGSYLIATKPLSGEQQARILPRNSAVCDRRVALDYYRLSSDGRLLFGGLCNYSGRHPKNIASSLYPRMIKLFPELAGIGVDYQWGGMIGIGANRMPQIGVLDNTIFYAQAYSGHGVNATHMAAQILAQAIHGEQTRLKLFNSIPHMTFPGGKLFRSPLLALGMLWYRLKELI